MSKDFSKLPKWARDELDARERRIRGLEGSLALRTGEESGPVVVEPYSGAPLHMHAETHVNFTLPDGCVIGCSIEGDGVRVSGKNCSVVVVPMVANVVTVKPHKGKW